MSELQRAIELATNEGLLNRNRARLLFAEIARRPSAEPRAILDRAGLPEDLIQKILELINDEGPDGSGSMVGETFGDFQILQLIARGEVGALYEGRHRKTDQEVALRILSQWEVDPAQQAAFLARGRAVKRLDHPAIVKVFEVGEEGGSAYLAMDLVKGDTLDNRLKTLSEPDLVRIFSQVARGLGEGHALGIVHGELKPRNIVFREDGTPVVTGFGFEANSNPAFLATGELLATVAYLSPEQGRGEDPCPATDVHAIGAMLYEGLTRVRPFAAPTTAQVTKAIMYQKPTQASQLRPDLHPRLEAAVMQSLHKVTGARFTNGTLLADELDACLAELEAESIPIWLPIVAGGMVVLVLVVLLVLAFR